MTGSLIIIAFFIFGAACGYSEVLNLDISGVDAGFITLAALIFCVGLGIGHNAENLMGEFRRLGLRVLLLPLATILGTLGACAVVSFFLPDTPLNDALAVGSGFGYYSLSSIFITEYCGVELGTIALLSNIIREIVTLLCAPLLCRYFGPFAPISSGGATSMDTTLPVIVGTSGSRFAVLSVYHGFVLDFSVPFLVTFFCSL